MKPGRFRLSIHSPPTDCWSQTYWRYTCRREGARIGKYPSSALHSSGQMKW